MKKQVKTEMEKDKLGKWLRFPLVVREPRGEPYASLCRLGWGALADRLDRGMVSQLKEFLRNGPQ